MKKVLIGLMLSIGIAVTALSVNAVDNKTLVPVQQDKAHQPAAIKPLLGIDINSADADDLSDLKGIGPKKAQAIVAYRKKNGPFKSLGDLSSVKGFGEKSVARLIKNNPDQLTAKP